MSFKKFRGSVTEKPLSCAEQQEKIDEVRKTIGPIADKFPVLCSDASIARYLRARNWNTKKACKMLKGTLKWRLEFNPEKIRWEDVAVEAKTGKIYPANFHDKQGRTVLVMRPGLQHATSSPGDQIKYLVYCMENAIMNMNSDQEQMVWLIDFQLWTLASISVKVTRETANVLQDHYPERLALGILYNPPKLFESFWTIVKPFLETKTYKKVKFVYSDDPQSLKLMEEIFDTDKLEPAFGGKSSNIYDYDSYAERMKEEDKKMTEYITCGYPSPLSYEHLVGSASQQTESENVSDVSDEDRDSCSNEIVSSHSNISDKEKANDGAHSVEKH